MIIWGVSAGHHDASISVLDDHKLVFAAHSERYSKVKNDKTIHRNLLSEALSISPERPRKIIWYEDPRKTTMRHLFSRNWSNVIRPSPRKLIGGDVPIVYSEHHLSHAAGGYYTSKFNEAAVLVIDAVGESESSSIWYGCNNKLTKVKSWKYPNSIGLFYSAVTSLIGLKPNEEEYILMGMAAYGDPHRYMTVLETACTTNGKFTPYTLKDLHRGIFLNFEPNEQDTFDLAASCQLIYEDLLRQMLAEVKDFMPFANNLVFSGGCALNCLGNRILYDFFDNVWIMPNPGDAGSSLGAALSYTKKRTDFTPYLGSCIQSDYQFNSDKINAIVKYLVNPKHGVCGLVHGRAEFGPRALGNRSLIADPRDLNNKNLVNKIKNRQKFRPLAPIIMEEHADSYFGLEGRTSPYMQYAVKCLKPDEIPAVTHIDGTSRVQTVNYNQNPFLYKLLKAWYVETGCPVLLNTSLNIKGMPLVNDRKDALNFEQTYKIRVFK